MARTAAATEAAPSQHTNSRPASPMRGHLISPLAAVAAAWIAAGSAGLLGHPLRHALTLLFLGIAFITGVPSEGRSWRRVLILTCAGATAALMVASPLIPVNVMACGLLLAALAWTQRTVFAGETPAKAVGTPALQADPFIVGSVAILVLALYRHAILALPWFWLLTDRIGAALSGAAGFVLRQPLHTGATYGGLDFLVLMSALLAQWFARLPQPRLRRSIQPGLLIIGAHFVYLAVLAFSPKLLNILPAKGPEPQFGQKAPWDFAFALRSLIPWNLPSLAALVHLCVAGFLLKSLTPDERLPSKSNWLDQLPKFAVPAAVTLSAVVVPLLTSMHVQRLSLADKKIVVYEKGFLNWLKPQHGEYGRLSIGMYGMLSNYLASYGAQCVISPDLSESDLKGAHALMLIFPNKPWAEGQLDRIWKFVRDGGSLLLLGEHTVREKEGGNRFNDVLQPTSMRVAFDSSMFEIGGWLESYDALSHPTTVGLQDHRNEFGVVIGASVEAHWPAWPVLAGRYGFSDLSDPANDESKGGSMMGNHRYDPGEKLSDQLLVAEQRFGRGRIMVFGDTSSFSNGILIGAHDYVSRVFAYLCSGSDISSVRLAIATVVFALLVFGLFLIPKPGTLALGALVFSTSFIASVSASHRNAQLFPDGRKSTPNLLAYLDMSHAERNSSESWREEGLGGLQLTLMRNGYLVLGMPEFNVERLQRAGLLISAGPSRKFTAKETQALREFIEGGGTFICTVGWPEADASRAMLSEFGFYVGGIGAATTGLPEPKPFGHFKAPYYNGGDYMAYVRFHAAWSVESSDPQARPIAYGPRDPKGPPDQPDPAVILMRRIGRGKMIVVADTDFATNRNLEHEGGQPFEGMRENADFWRWLLATLNDLPPWTPPKPIAPAPATTNAPPVKEDQLRP